MEKLLNDYGKLLLYICKKYSSSNNQNIFTISLYNIEQELNIDIIQLTINLSFLMNELYLKYNMDSSKITIEMLELGKEFSMKFV